jgi:hypothetical protein
MASNPVELHEPSARADRAASVAAALFMLSMSIVVAIGTANGATDTQAPTIVAHRSPSANAAGWNNTPVTVWFTCSDNIAGVRCPEQVILEDSGRNQLVRGTATDATGNTASASVTISIDREAPALRLTSAFAAETTRSMLQVTASVEDALSGSASGGCNGAGAPVMTNTLACGVPLRPGRNIVLVHVVDAAGNTASASAQTIRVSSGNIELQATPAAATVSIGEDWRLSVVDQFGRRPSGATWSTSDPGIASIKRDDDGAISASGVAPGVATLTATVGEATATMRLVVLADSGAWDPPRGTVRWSAPERANIADSATIFAGYGGDALYSIEYATSDHRQVTIRAHSINGNENSMGALPVDDSEAVLDVMLHASGGLLFVVNDDSDGSSAVIHYAGGQGRHWRYQSSAHSMQAVTGGDGSVFIVEHHELTPGKERSQIVVLDGNGRAVVKQVLPQFIITTQLSGSTVSREPASDPVGFVVDGRGHARFMIVHGEQFASRTSSWVEYELDLYAVAPDGSMQAIQLDSVPRREITASSNAVLRPESIIPDAEGVLALYTKRESGSQGEQWHGKYLGAVRTAFTLPGPWRPTVSTIEGFGIGRDTTAGGPLVARSLRTGAIHWQRSIAGVAALGLSGGGAAVRDDNGGIREVNAQGPIGEVDQLGIGRGPYAGARFHVRDANHTLRAVIWKPINDGTAYIIEDAEGRRKSNPRR